MEKEFENLVRVNKNSLEPGEWEVWKEVMDLGLFSMTKKIPRDNHIVTKAEGTLHKHQGKLFWVSQVTAWEVQPGH